MRPLLLVLLLAPATSLAWPVDWIHDVEAGREKFVRLPSLDWFEVDDPQVLGVEWLASGELLLVGLKPGRATVLLGAQGRVAAWRVRVGTVPVTDQAALVAAQKACPSLELTPLAEVKLTVTVSDEPCRKALFTLFQTDAFEARQLKLTFESKVLQAQLASVQQGVRSVSPRVSARYVGAGLVLEGAASTTAQKHQLLWEVLRRAIGRFTLDDQVSTDQPLDAGPHER